VAADHIETFAFAPVDLSEDVEIDIGRRKEILFVHAHLGDWDHWRLLGIPWNAGAEEARAAYRERVKIFHPDRYPGRRLGSFRSRLEHIFRKLTEAKDVLGDEARRAAYATKTAAPEDFARIEARRLQDEERAKERRARLARGNPLLARAAQVSDLIERGKKAMEESRFSQAANDFMTAAGLDARNLEAKQLAIEAKKRASGERAREAFERGLAAEAVNNVPVALAFFLESVSADPGNPKYAVQASRISLRVGDVQSARTLAETAVRVGPRHAPAHEVLGEVLLAEGLSKDGRKSLEKALEIDPGLETARAQLKKLRWSFLG
jgi:curved DNA-binding protein CbpA